MNIMKHSIFHLASAYSVTEQSPRKNVWTGSVRALWGSCLVATLIVASTPAVAPAMDADQILKTTGFKGGLIVHLGCGDGQLTATLGQGDGRLAHGLDARAEQVSRALEHFQRLGLSGKVFAEHWLEDRLPYADNFVNLLVLSGEGGMAVTSNEIMRVLAPNGTALFLSHNPKGETQKWVKPWPREIDEWTHWLHDAGNNAVARDTLVGPPKRIQWVAEPLWSRGHEVPSSVGGVVTARGRIFYVVDEGQSGIYTLPSRWTLVARDAFNGILLWKHPVPDWGPALSFGGFGNGFRPRRYAA